MCGCRVAQNARGVVKGVVKGVTRASFGRRAPLTPQLKTASARRREENVFRGVYMIQQVPLRKLLWAKSPFPAPSRRVRQLFRELFTRITRLRVNTRYSSTTARAPSVPPVAARRGVAPRLPVAAARRRLLAVQPPSSHSRRHTPSRPAARRPPPAARRVAVAATTAARPGGHRATQRIPTPPASRGSIYKRAQVCARKKEPSREKRQGRRSAPACTCGRACTCTLATARAPARARAQLCTRKKNSQERNKRGGGTRPRARVDARARARMRPHVRPRVYVRALCRPRRAAPHA